MLTDNWLHLRGAVDFPPAPSAVEFQHDKQLNGSNSSWIPALHVPDMGEFMLNFTKTAVGVHLLRVRGPAVFLSEQHQAS